VAALVVRPKEAGALPAVVYAHGGSEDGKHHFLDEAIELSLLGATVLLPDAGVPIVGDVEADARTVHAAMLVQRRGIDLLVETEAATRLGYFGHSGGGAQGAMLSAVEPRLDAIVVAAWGSGIVRRSAAEMPNARPTREAYRESAERSEPEHYVSRPGSRRLLFQHGLRDELVSVEEARRMYAAAAPPKSWREYDCSHELDEHLPARADRIAFFSRELRL
jgi:dipeptidyl aminopeptidase/acylaminoacyl peptidase